jgi:hypothetical protein
METDMSTDTITEEHKQRLIDKYRDINVDWGDWWESTIECFAEDCADQGIAVATNKSGSLDVAFSLGYSQSDYASFAGYISEDTLELFIKTHAHGSYPITSKLIAEGGWVRVNWSSNDRFRFGVSVDSDLIEGVLGSDHPFAEMWDAQLADELYELERLVESTNKAMCKKLYNILQDEYEYLTSDEAVWETIVANELDQEEQDNE